MFDQLVKQLAEKEGITGQPKAQDQMGWVGAMNNIANEQGNYCTRINCRINVGSRWMSVRRLLVTFIMALLVLWGDADKLFPMNTL